MPAIVPIVLTTLNARYAHASLGLRCLRANLGALREQCAIREFVIGQKTEEIVERILTALKPTGPRIVGLGVYIWNVDESTRVVAMLKRVAPDVTVVLGGPEVSFEIDEQRICTLADFVITGWGDVTFAKLAQQILDGPRPLMKVHAGEDARPLDPQVVYRAIAFIRALPDSVPLPEFAAEPDGAMSLEWIRSRSRIVSVSVGAGDRLAFAGLDGTDHGHGVARLAGGVVPARIVAAIAAIIDVPDAGVRPA